MGNVIIFDGSRKRPRFIRPYPQTIRQIQKTVAPAGANQFTETRILYRYETLRQSVEVISAQEGLSRLFTQDVIRRALALKRAA